MSASSSPNQLVNYFPQDEDGRAIFTLDPKRTSMSIDDIRESVGGLRQGVFLENMYDRLATAHSYLEDKNYDFTEKEVALLEGLTRNFLNFFNQDDMPVAVYEFGPGSVADKKSVPLLKLFDNKLDYAAIDLQQRFLEKTKDDVSSFVKNVVSVQANFFTDPSDEYLKVSEGVGRRLFLSLGLTPFNITFKNVHPPYTMPKADQALAAFAENIRSMRAHMNPGDYFFFTEDTRRGVSAVAPYRGDGNRKFHLDMLCSLLGESMETIQSVWNYDSLFVSNMYIAHTLEPRVGQLWKLLLGDNMTGRIALDPGSHNKVVTANSMRPREEQRTNVLEREGVWVKGTVDMPGNTMRGVFCQAF